jgi:hypothetical protein
MSSTVMRCALVALATVLLTSGAHTRQTFSQPETPTGSVSGKVFEKASRAALAGVTVRAHLITTNQWFAGEPTDARGGFYIAEVPAGIYAFSLEHEGKEYPVSGRLDVRVGMAFLLESCFQLDTGSGTANVLRECKSEVYAESQVVSIGPHRFFRPQDESLAYEDSEMEQLGVRVEHAGIDCIAHDKYAQFEATIKPGEDVATSRVYFRAEQYPDFYYVEMEGNGDNFMAILPKPSPETERIIYYIEAVDFEFNSAQSDEHAPEVTDSESCERRDPATAYFVGEAPNIVVGSVGSGLPAVPAGFQAAGITGFISATGVVTGTAAGAGLSTAGTIIVAGGAAVGSTAVVIETTTGETEASPPNDL